MFSWKKRLYTAILIDADSYLLELIRYRNPLEAGLVNTMDRYPWSSHQGYLSDAEKWGWLYKDFVLSLFSDDKRLGRKRYREFVSRESAEEISVILAKKKLPAMLGSKGFIERMRQMFSVEKRHVEVPKSRSLTPDVRRIRAVVCKSYNVTEEALTATRRGTANEARNVAIYLKMVVELHVQAIENSIPRRMVPYHE